MSDYGYYLLPPSHRIVGISMFYNSHIFKKRLQFGGMKRVFFLHLLSFYVFSILLITVLACVEFQGASGGKVTLINHSVHEEKLKEPSNEFDNEPLSRWIEEINMSSAIDSSGKLTFIVVPSHHLLSD